jgi:hypothetical protein
MSPLARFNDADWTLVPPRLQAPLERWLVDGQFPRSAFLNFVLRNDLVAAVRAGSPAERAALADIVFFLMTECPGEAYGSVEDWKEWRHLGGWRGMRNETEKEIYP